MPYQSAVSHLYGLQKHGIKLGLENPRRLLSALGDPQGSFRSVHVAGTNGKGSTSAFISALLRSSGARTGLFTSPHMVSFTERIRVGGREISRGDVIRLTDKIRRVVESIPGFNPTFFEFVTAMGFLYFGQKAVDWAVVETGMGGRLDATNVLRPEVTVITRVDMDHAAFLGETIGEIAIEKAGIIKKNVPVITTRQHAAAMKIIERKAAESGAALYVLGRDFDVSVLRERPGSLEFDYRDDGLEIRNLLVRLNGAHQAENAALAIRAARLALGDDFSVDVARAGLRSLRWPGRLERIASSPPVYVDGAHNPGAALALAATVRDVFMKKYRRVVLVLGMMDDKDASGFMIPLLPLADEVICTAPAYERAARPSALAETAFTLGRNVTCANSVREAVKKAASLAGRDGFVLVTGSFYTIGEAKEALGKRGSMPGLGEREAKRPLTVVK